MNLKRSVLFLTFLCTSAFAEIPNSGYYRLQESCKDYFDIKIKSQKIVNIGGTTERLTWTAEITDIWRSSTKVKLGQVITIQHDQFKPDQMAPGPSRAPRQKVGAIVPAFLSRQKNGTYSLAKYGRSFEVMTRPKDL